MPNSILMPIDYFDTKIKSALNNSIQCSLPPIRRENIEANTKKEPKYMWSNCIGSGIFYVLSSLAVLLQYQLGAHRETIFVQRHMQHLG